MTDSEEENLEFFEDEPDDKLSYTYKLDPTIQQYLKLRREHPDKIIEVAATGGIEWLFDNEKMLADYGIDGDLVACCLDADNESQSKLSLQLLDMLSNREALIASGETHVSSRGVAISDQLVNYLIALMLDAQSWTSNLELPRDLVVLIRYQLFGGNDTAMDRTIRKNELNDRIVHLAAVDLENNLPLSKRSIAKRLKVNVSTVSRMFPDGQLKKSASERLNSMRKMLKTETPFRDIAAEHIRKMEGLDD